MIKNQNKHCLIFLKEFRRLKLKTFVKDELYFFSKGVKNDNYFSPE